ncbi:alkaline phosphatase family protein [Nesterenkonia massiliensis]|uniref:Alkaline phosphatase family protein n=1 Tax=Nesterenkonia massiliensis TaxID=1232429 RepID=A0ABT2HMY4_9MICC|nr:alkaline phosphatase family protein [Nesterenkonia massiliensis]MCT1606055.1 alkaline phosphatase family protein [Nesterenkonia massiliensis]
MSLPLPPAPDYDGAHLRHVLPSACAALGLEGFANRLDIPRCSIAVVIMVDGLGDHNLAAHTGHARFLASAWRRAAQGRVLDCGAPATTSASLTSLGTGKAPGEHGMLGYDLLAPELGRVVNMLGGWDDDVDPRSWQRHPSVLQQAVDAGARVLTASRSQFRDSALTTAALSGGEFLGADRIESRFRAAQEWIMDGRIAKGGVRRGPAPAQLVYLYVDELDKTGHHAGVDSVMWRSMLENLDEAARRLCSALTESYGDEVAVLLTADHGMLDIAEQDLVDIAERDDLLRGVAHTGGDPRMMYLYAEAEQDPVELAARWRAEFGDVAWVLTRDKAIAAGWFGAVEERVLGRLGDVIIAAHAPIAIFDTARTGVGIMSMVGMHGSLTEVERKIPLLELTGRGFTG